MVGRHIIVGRFRGFNVVFYVYLVLMFFANALSVKFLEQMSLVSPEVPVQMQMIEQCVGNGTSIYVIPESERTCPCPFFVSDEHSSLVDGEYLIVRKKDFNAWLSKGSGRNLVTESRIDISPPNLSRETRRIDIPNEGNYILVVRTTAKTAQCVRFDYMLAIRDKKSCPTRMNSGSTEDPYSGIRHNIISGTMQVDRKIQNFMVGLYTPGRGACTGSVIGKHWILTAAHCRPKVNSTRISVGGKYFSSGTEHVITEVYTHPKYSSGVGIDGRISSAVINDAVLIRTKFSIDVTPIGVNNNPNIPQPRAIVRAAGYGLTYSESSRGSLNSVDVSEIPMKECQQDYKDVSGGFDLEGLVTKYHLCAGPDESCDGGVCRGKYMTIYFLKVNQL